MSTQTILTEQLAAQTAEADRIASTFKVDEKGRFDISGEQFRDYKTKIANVKEIKSLLDDLKVNDEARNFLDAPDGVPEAAQGLNRNEVKSLGDAFVNSQAYRNYAANAERWEGSAIRAEIEGKSIFNLSAGNHTLPAIGGYQDLGIQEAQRRKWHVRDLFPKSSTKASVLYGIRETGFTNNAALVFQRNTQGENPASTGWGAPAPKSEIHLATELYPVAEIAHTITAHKNILADEPRLKSFINSRMVEGVKFAEDRELLFGTGGAERITGLTETADVQRYSGAAQDKASIQVRRAITKALLAEYDPTGLVVGPERWEELEIETDDTGAFRVAVQVAIGAEKRIWRLNVVETTAMPADKFLMGAFGMGAQLHDRETVKVSVSTENADNFERGLVTVRADERVALEVMRPESFVYGTFTPYVP